MAATSGRAFWILDDLTALQTTMGKPDSTQLQLFAPKITTKFALNKSQSKSIGHNPLPGVIIDYNLPHDFVDSLTLTLEIIDERGIVIRSLSNQKDKEYKKWIGGPSAKKTIPSTPGLNRTNWDLRREQLPAVEDIFVLGSYDGALVGPGNYTLRLTYLDKSEEQPLTIKADPRIEATAADFEEQQKMLTLIETTIKDIHESVTQLRVVKKQLTNTVALLKDQPDTRELVEKGKEAMKAITEWEEKLIQPRQKTFQDVINFENKLNAELMMLKSRVDAYAPQPTEGMKERLEEMMKEWAGHKNEMNIITKEHIDGFNELYQKSNYPILIIPGKGRGKA